MNNILVELLILLAICVAFIIWFSLKWWRNKRRLDWNRRIIELQNKFSSGHIPEPENYQGRRKGGVRNGMRHMSQRGPEDLF